MASDIKESYFKNVSSLTEDAREFIIPSGESWEIQSWNGSANPYRDTHVSIIWDYGGEEEIISLTYTSLKSNISRTFTGDGVRKLAIVLRNDSSSPERLGAEFVYRMIE